MLDSSGLRSRRTTAQSSRLLQAVMRSAVLPPCPCHVLRATLSETKTCKHCRIQTSKHCHQCGHPARRAAMLLCHTPDRGQGSGMLAMHPPLLVLDPCQTPDQIRQPSPGDFWPARLMHRQRNRQPKQSRHLLGLIPGQTKFIQQQPQSARSPCRRDPRIIHVPETRPATTSLPGEGSKRRSAKSTTCACARPGSTSADPASAEPVR